LIAFYTTSLPSAIGLDYQDPVLDILVAWYGHNDGKRVLLAAKRRDIADITERL
jgi:hypothetical protein